MIDYVMISGYFEGGYTLGVVHLRYSSGWPATCV